VTSLEGRVVVIAVGDPSTRAAAVACASQGAAVVLVCTTADDAFAGEIVSEVGAAGGRAAVFAGSLESDADRQALAEMLAELF
jgi:electron transfer flavoprotein alpha/beta subunit